MTSSYKKQLHVLFRYSAVLKPNKTPKKAGYWGVGATEGCDHPNNDPSPSPLADPKPPILSFKNGLKSVEGGGFKKGPPPLLC